jgi:excisionase family DNA binding protein
MSEEPIQDLEVLWTPQQLAKYLNISKVSVYRWISEKRVLDPAKLIRIGRAVRIPRSEVERIAGIKKKELNEKLQPK